MDQPKSEVNQEPEETLGNRDSDSDTDAGCPCQRWCLRNKEVNLRSIKKLKNLVKRYLNSKPNKKVQSNAFHVIKLMKELIEKVGQGWEEYKEICVKGSDPLYGNGW